MADAPYKEDDYVNLDSGERGYVRSIGLRSTRIMTRDDIEITIPNKRYMISSQSSPTCWSGTYLNQLNICGTKF